MKTIARIGAAIMLAGAGAAVVCLALALSGSGHAPAYRQFFIPAFVCVGGMLIVTLDAFRAAMARLRALPWRVEAALPAEVAIEARRALRPRQDPHLRVFALVVATNAVLLFTMLAYVPALKWSALRHEGVETSGTITSVHGGQVDYDFPRGTGATAGSARARGMRVGDRTPVTYLRAVPWVSLPKAKGEIGWLDFLDMPATAVLLLLLMIAAMLPAAGRRARKPAEHLMYNGEAAIATVTRVRGRVVHYACGERRGTYVHLNRDAPQPAEGDPFVVLLVDAKTITPWIVLRPQFEEP
jgi:hypothetical protein